MLAPFSTLRLASGMNVDLRVRGISPSSVFALLGQDENSATYALGWTLAKCPSLLTSFLNRVIEQPLGADAEVQIELQRSHDAGGFTDIEVIAPNLLHVIIEAKRDWLLPSEEQLSRYRQRLRPDAFAHTGLISLSAASAEYASRRLPPFLDAVRVAHLSWAEVQGLARIALRQATKPELRIWLSHLDRHLGAFVSMQNPQDNQVLVVVLSADPIRATDTYTWIDVVERDRRYFHPYGKHWPTLPPNYIGFRYGGQLRSVHHIEHYEVVDRLTDVDPRWPDSDGAHMVYRLGPPMTPATTVANGAIYRAAHAWCAIDTLLSGAFLTLSDARDETNRRLNRE